MTDPSPAFSTVIAAFERMEWSCEAIEGREVVEAEFEAHHTRVHLHVQAFAELNAVSVVARATHQCPVGTAGFPAVCELLMRINRDLTIGNFEVDPDSGAILFRATNLFPPDGGDPRIVASLVHSSVAEIDRATPYLAIVLATPPEALPRFDLAALLRRPDLLPRPPERD